MKILTITKIIATLLISSLTFAHDEGHGPKLGDQPKFSGKVAAVINKKEINKGTKATMLYKAELTKNAKNVIRVYFYDKKMTLMKLDGITSASGELLFKSRDRKKMENHKFKLKKVVEKNTEFFEGTLPTKPRRPFNVDVTLDEKDKKLFIAFDGLS